MNNWLSQFLIPRLKREDGIAVYLVHNTRDPEDYFFPFVYEAFVARSRSGPFVACTADILPVGRFQPPAMRRQFREVFAAELVRMRNELTSGRGKRGWLDKNRTAVAAVDVLAGAVAVIVLAIAPTLNRAVFGGMKSPRLLKRGGRKPSLR